jgi:hypothetical protein
VCGNVGEDGGRISMKSQVCPRRCGEDVGVVIHWMTRAVRSGEMEMFERIDRKFWWGRFGERETRQIGRDIMVRCRTEDLRR